MDPLTLIAFVSAGVTVIQKAVALIQDLQSGRIKPEDIDPETLRMPTVSEIEDLVRQGKL